MSAPSVPPPRSAVGVQSLAGPAPRGPLPVAPVAATPAMRMRYLLFGRIVPGALYAILGMQQIGVFTASLRDVTGTPGKGFLDIVAGPVQHGLYTLFCVIPVVIYLARPMPRARAGTPGARAAALVGTTLLLFVGTIREQGHLLYVTPAAVQGLLTVLIAVVTGFEVYALAFLRNSFSIIPEARRLVTGGPYHFVRHPLYASEILVAVLYVVAVPYPLGVGALIPFVALQLTRMDYEETLLTATFDEYGAYAARTARLVPFIW